MNADDGGYHLDLNQHARRSGGDGISSSSGAGGGSVRPRGLGRDRRATPTAQDDEEEA